MHAQPTHQTLRQHAAQRRRQQERLYAHVDQSRDGRARCVGMQRRQHQMARQARLNGDLGGFAITDFTDNDDIRIMAKYGA